MKNNSIVLGACALLLMAGTFVLWGRFSSGRDQEDLLIQENREAQEFDGAIEGSSTIAATRRASRYKELYESYLAGSLLNDPVAIEKFVMLSGACESGTQVVQGGQISSEVKRLREFCALHFSSREEAAYRINGLSSKTYSAKLKERMRNLQSSAGIGAVRRELSVELRSSDPYRAQMALEYAANAGVVPEELESVVDKSDASLSKQLSILSHIEFCRRGGECGGTDFPALSACVALPPCPTNLDLLQVIRRASAPRDYEAALKMSDSLHQRR